MIFNLQKEFFAALVSSNVKWIRKVFVHYKVNNFCIYFTNVQIPFSHPLYINQIKFGYMSSIVCQAKNNCQK